MGYVLINSEREAKTIFAKVSSTTTTGNILTNAERFENITVLAKAEFLQFSRDPCPVVYPAKDLHRQRDRLQPQDVQNFLSLETKWRSLLTNETLSILHGLTDDKSLTQALKELAQVHTRLSKEAQEHEIPRPHLSEEEEAQEPETPRKRAHLSEEAEEPGTSRKRQRRTKKLRVPRQNLPVRLTQTLTAAPNTPVQPETETQVFIPFSIIWLLY